MARIPEGHPMYGTVGRVGDLIYYKMNGKYYVKTCPKPNKNKKRSDAQIRHQQSFSAMHEMAQSVKLPLIDRVWKTVPMGGGMTPYSLFITSNKMAFGKSEKILYPESLRVSKGKLYPAVGLSAEKEGDTITFKWDASMTGLDAEASNRLNIVQLIDRKELKITLTEANRGDGKASITIPEGSEFTEGYIFWSSWDETAFSDSNYWKCQ